MKLVIYLIFILIFPLAFFLFFDKEDISFLKNKKVEAVRGTENESGKILGSEKLSGAKADSDSYPAINFQPVKKEGVTDLSVPGAHSSLILDVDSGTILHYYNGRERRSIASLTKLMTAVVVLENIKDLNEEVAIDEEAVYSEGTRVGCPRSGYCVSNRLKVGEKMSVENLLKAILMNSANDAAIALAKHISGTEKNFVELMNKKAHELGLRDSNFCTASGLEIDGEESECYSSAYDIARVAAYSMKYDLIWEIMRLPNNLVVYSSDGKYSHEIINTDIIMDQVSGFLGGKTGFTPMAGHSLLMAATDPGKKHKIISVVLDDPYRWQDIKTMVNWAFGAYEWR